MEDYRTQCQTLREQAEELPAGRVQIELFEEAVQLADSARDIELGFDLRLELMQAATFAGFPDRLLVAFAWCLAQCDRNPQEYSDHQLLWQYKWSAATLADFPQITRAQIQATLSDMERRFARAGASLRPVHKLRYRLAWMLGDHAEAREHYEHWAVTQHDFLNDCGACERDHEVEFLLRQNKLEDAWTRAQPLVSGRMKCASVPHTTFGRLVVPLFQLGQDAEAVRLHQRGLRLIRGKAEHLYSLSRHIQFLTITDNLPRAGRLIEQGLLLLANTTNPYTRFYFRVGIRMFLQRLLDVDEQTVLLRVPSDFPVAKTGRRFAVADLVAWNEVELQSLLNQFNARNGNTWCSELLAEHDALVKQARAVSLTEQEE